METTPPEAPIINILIFDTPEKVALAAAERFVANARAAIAEHGLFSVALAGGNTPRRVYELLASDPYKNRIEWSRVHLFFGDERGVPPDHADSNYGMVYKALMSAIEVPPSNVHRIAGERNPEVAAAEYEQALRAFYGQVDWPRFDLALLGMGEDGHTASLFPGSDAVREESKWAVATRIENLQIEKTRMVNPSRERITLTVPVFNHAAHVLFLVTGKGKAERLAEVVSASNDAQIVGNDPLPTQLIHPLNGLLEWLIDRPAASKMKSETEAMPIRVELRKESI